MFGSDRGVRNTVVIAAAAMVIAAGAATCARAATAASSSQTGTTKAPAKSTAAAPAKTARPVSYENRNTVEPVRAPVVKRAPEPGKRAPLPARKLAPPEDSTLTLKGGQEGTVFRSLTVEGEDRIHFEVERPALRLELDPSKAPGLDWGSARDVMDRTVPDVMAPLLAGSAREASPYTGRPWLSHFASGAVARFRPAVEDVERWKLTVANWRGEPVTSFQGSGKPPKEIVWDGRGANGSAVMPGRTYSYVFEATDRAGNRRNFVGEGFRVAAFRVASGASTAMVFTATEMSESGSAWTGAHAASAVPGTNPAPPVILEAASWLNQGGSMAAPIVVTATARNAEEAAALATRVQNQLSPLLVGESSRLRSETRIESDAPAGGAVAIATGTPPAPASPARRK